MATKKTKVVKKAAVPIKTEEVKPKRKYTRKPKVLAAMVEVPEEPNETFDKNEANLNEYIEHELKLIRETLKSTSSQYVPFYPSKNYVHIVKKGEKGSSVFYGFNTCGMQTGCGVLQGQGISQFIRSDEGVEVFNEHIKPKIIEDIKNGRAGGAVFCTLGMPFYSVRGAKERMKKMGFEEVACYNNYQHAMNGSYKQKMYILKLKR